jgi:hypothetical protein
VRFLVAIVCFVLAVAAIGLGIAERTVLAGPDKVTSSTTAQADAPLVVIDGSALNAYPHTQTLQLVGGKSAFAAYGRTADVMAWVGDATYTRVSYNKATGKLVSKTHVGKHDTVPNPSGSDLWLAQYTGDEARSIHLNVPSDVSVIAASNGKSPAPATVKVSWPIDNSNPFSGPLVIGGGCLLLLGLVLLVWALVHMRRARGPRRNQPKMPKLPRAPRYKPRKVRALAAPKGRRSITRFAAIPVVVVAGAVALGGCSMIPIHTAATPTATPKAAPTSSLEAPAVTPSQLQHIVDEVSTVSAKADAALNTTLIGTRFAGPALELRTANYAERKADSTLPGAAAIPSSEIDLTLPQASNTWPRTVMTVVQNKNDAKVAPQALMLVQQTPRSNYKVEYAVALQPKAQLPKVAPATIGAPAIPAGIKLLKLAPTDLAAAYGDILMKDKASTSYDLFQADGDDFRTQVGLAAKQAEIAALPTTATAAFSNTPGTGQVLSLSTNDSGALVAVNLDENQTVTPAKAGATLTAVGATKALLGKATTTTGFARTYGDQLLFYVPRAAQDAKIVLLGFSQGLITAKEVG